MRLPSCTAAVFLTIPCDACKIWPAFGKTHFDIDAEIAQLVEHATENRGVVSSILSLGTRSESLAK